MRRPLAALAAAVFGVTAVTTLVACATETDSKSEEKTPDAASKATDPSVETKTAVFAGGCFWCMEPPFEKLKGVLGVVSGYAGGAEKNPTYEQVSAGSTGHAEVVQVTYDPSKVTYDELLDVFWKNVDPTVKDRQFCDKGAQYRTGIFYADDAQKKAAEASKAALAKEKPFEAEIVTEISPFDAFWPAEEYHQDYYKKHPIRYAYYRRGCGRDARLKEVWER